MRICIDVDGTICRLRGDGESYSDVLPLPGAVEKLQEMRASGHTIILHTARHMSTCAGNEGLVLARQGKVLFDWLERFDVPFDEIYFGKPQADLYIDDNALRFEGDWSSISADVSQLPVSSERMAAHK